MNTIFARNVDRDVFAAIENLVERISDREKELQQDLDVQKARVNQVEAELADRDAELTTARDERDQALTRAEAAEQEVQNLRDGGDPC